MRCGMCMLCVCYQLAHPAARNVCLFVCLFVRCRSDDAANRCLSYWDSYKHCTAGRQVLSVRRWQDSSAGHVVCPTLHGDMSHRVVMGALPGQKHPQGRSVNWCCCWARVVGLSVCAVVGSLKHASDHTDLLRSIETHTICLGWLRMWRREGHRVSDRQR